MQGSLFIANDYLGFKRRKLSFLYRSSLKNKKTTHSRGSWVPTLMGLDAGESGALAVAAPGAGASEAVPLAQFLAFSSCFRSFFRLETPRNLKWIFFTLYCLQKPYKNYCPSISYTLSFTWCVDLLNYMISHYKTLKTRMKLHDLG